MSEDLDFMLPTPPETPRGTRRKMISPIKNVLSHIPERFPVFSISKELIGSNESTQYQAEITYKSCISEQQTRIKVEIGLREEVLRKPLQGKAKTLLLNPFTGTDIVSPINVVCLDVLESFAEKFRAALSRKNPAIRDLYDIWYAITKNLIPTQDKAFRNPVRSKVLMSGNDLKQLTEERLAIFRKQIETDLRPVLSEENFKNFDFERVVDLIQQMIEELF